MELGLDLAHGVQLWRQEIYGDWHRDPWDWPELAWTERRHSTFPLGEFVERKPLRLRTSPAFHLIDIPKDLLGSRPAVVQDPLSRLLYLSGVATIGPVIHNGLPNFVHGWRFRGNKNPESNGAEWASYLEQVRSGSGQPEGLRSDITSFFASVPIERLTDELFGACGDLAPIHLVDAILKEHMKLQTRSGLPQRSFGSAILANFYLKPLDDLLSRFVARGKAPTAMRWMDDITLFGREESLYSAHIELQGKMRSLRLEANASKSDLGQSGDIIRAVDLEAETPFKIRREPEPGPASGSFIIIPNFDDLDKLNEMEDDVLQNPRISGRTRVRAILKTLRDAQIYTFQSKWRGVAKYLPHAADHVGRYLRDAAAWGEVNDEGMRFGDLNEWLEDALDGEWSALDWVKAQLALSVPADLARSNLLDKMEEWLEHGSNVQLVGVAAQRLAQKRPGVCREIVNSRADSTYDPALLRVLCLATLSAKGSKTTARNLVDRDDSNQLLRLVLDERNWQAQSVPEDFSWGTSDQMKEFRDSESDPF